jgi:uncharacterized protein (TIGR03437 family)
VNEGVPVGIAADYTKLTASATPYTCTVQLSFSDGSLQTVSLLAIVTSSGAPADNAGRIDPRAAGHPDAQGCSPMPPVFLNPGTGFNATAYQANEMDIQVQDSCGNPIDTFVVMFSEYTGGNGDPNADFVGLTSTAPGLYKYQWTPTNMPQNVSQSAVTLIAAYVPSATNITPLSSELSGTVSLTPSPARIASVTNAASYTNQMALGAIVAIFGDSLADGVAEAGQVPLPTELQGTKVFVDNLQIPLFYVSGTQINAQIPYTLSPNSPHQLIVVHDNTQANPQTFTLVQAEPAIFTTNAEGFGQGAIVGPDNITLADAANPVPVGKIVVIYCSGLGPVTPAVTAGDPTPASVPLPQVQPGLTVTIDNIPATDIKYAGLSPYFVGLYQVNVTVPAGVQPGNAVPVTITVGTLQSQPGVTLAVAP